ncbi:MAG: M28 family peptidase [Bacteroidales bacterium]|nr:M28 family peptidase [Bacteroidales bacterium]
MNRILLLLPALWIPFSLLAQGVSFSSDKDTIRTRLVRDVAVLASDSLQGREAGTVGEWKAATYLGSQFRAIGLLPKGNEAGSFYQRFQNFQVGFHGSTHFLVDGNALVYREDFGVTALSKNGHAIGLLVDGSQGLVIPEKGIDQLDSSGNLKGTFILIDLHVDRTLIRDTSIAAKLTPRYRMKMALERGASGVIFWNPDSPWNKKLFDFQSTDTMPGIAVYVNSSIAERLKQNLGALADINVRIDRKTSIYTNVIGYIDNGAIRTIVIGAHFDHLGLKNDGRICYGADDNASGTAGMLEMARYFSTHRDTLNNYLFIAFSAEEKGLVGSNYFIAHPTISLSEIRFMLNLDMIGRLGCAGNIVKIEAVGSSSEWRRIIRDTQHHSFSIKRVSAALPYSDHSPFYKAGIPVLFFNTGLHEDYHTITDKLNTLNYDGMAEVIRFAEDLVASSDKASKISYHKVSALSQTSAWIGFLIQALGWVLTIN